MTNPIKSWLAAFPEQEAKAELLSLHNARADLNARIAELEGLMALHAQAPRVNGGQIELALPTNGSAPRGMDAVEFVLRETPERPWKRAALAHELVKRGWLAPGEPGRRTLGSILHRMVERGRVVRVGAGLYKLPASQQAVAA